MQYNEFLEQKEIVFKPSGFQVNRDDISPILFEFQRDLVLYALRKGKAGIFADTGLGKTPIQIIWADLVSKEFKKPVLIIAPLGVNFQTIDIARNLFGIEINYSNTGKPKGNITITNYEHVKKFRPEDYVGVALDEASILKGFDGHYKKLLTEMFADTLMKSIYTATPNPNDDEEIANHVAYLGIMTREDLLSTFFVHDGKTYRLKGHAETKFYKWMASWGMALQKPSDLGYDDNGFILPKLNIHPHFLRSDFSEGDDLFFTGLKGIRGRISARRQTYELKCYEASDMINQSNEQWIVWCGLNDESKLTHKLTKDSVEVCGSDSIDRKVEIFRKFQDGQIKVLVTKPKIAGFGLNFQNSWNSASIGMTDSFESFYQYIRRQYRFGQKHEVNAHIFLADVERQIWDNVCQKETRSNKQRRALIENIAEFEKMEITNLGQRMDYNPEVLFKLPKFLNGRSK
jgi:hypothetical protein